MKQIYNIAKEPICNYVKKEFSKDALKLVSNLSSDFNSLEIKDKIDVGLNRLSEKQSFTYKPSFIGKNIDEYNGLSNRIYRSFSTKVERMDKYADPKNDLVFKKLFGNEENKELLIDFINKVLPNKHVKDIEYLPTNLEPDIRIKKQSILDVLCTDENGSKYIIEMQNAKEKGFEERAVYYASKTYATQMDKGGKYADLKEVIFIAITDFIMFPKKEDYISTHTIRDNKTNEHDLKGFSFAFLELPKFNKQGNPQNIDQWCDLFKNAKNCKSVNTTDPIMKKAYETLEISNWSEQDLLDYQAYEKIILDNQAREDQVRDEGISIGKTKGINEEKIKIAINLKRTNIDPKIISEATGLSIEEISKL